MTVVFSGLDGTLIESVIPRVVDGCFRKTGIRPRNFKEILRSSSNKNKILFEKYQDIFNEEILKAKPIPETVKALESLPPKVQIVISSYAPEETTKKWLEKNNLETYLHFGREDGNKTIQIKKALRIDEYSRAIFIANDPADFNINRVMAGLRVRKIAVNVNPFHQFPKGTCVHSGPLTKSILCRNYRRLISPPSFFIDQIFILCILLIGTLP